MLDAIHAVELLRNDSRIDPSNVFVLGHSLGGMLVPRIGQQDSNIAGFIVMAGPTRPLEDLMMEQYENIFSLDGHVTKQEQDQINAVKQGVEKVKKLKDPDDLDSKERILGALPPYWLDLKGYNPAEEGAKCQQPMLILQGERDYQVTTVDFDGWKKAMASRNDVSFKLYPDLNHLFISGEGPPGPQEYLHHVGDLAGRIEELLNQAVPGFAGVGVAEEPVGADQEPGQRDSAYHGARKAGHRGSLLPA